MECSTDEATFAFWESYVKQHRELAEMNEAMGSGDVYNKQRDYGRVVDLLNFSLFGCKYVTSETCVVCPPCNDNG